MRVILDTNFATDPALEQWLKRSTGNVALLTDYFAMESYRTGSLAGVQRMYAILSRYPHQVQVLQNTGKLRLLPPRERGARRRMIDTSSTATFPKFCRALRDATPGSKFDLVVQSHIDAAEGQLAAFERNFVTTGSAIEGLAQAWAAPDLLSLRRPGQPLTDGAIRTTLEQIAGLARDLFDIDPQMRLPQSLSELPHSFAFRVALCGYLGYQGRLADGSTNALSASKARNDMVDALQGATALYFDGFFTNDRRAQISYLQAKVLMDTIFLGGPAHGATKAAAGSAPL